MTDAEIAARVRAIEPPSGFLIALWLLAIALIIAGPIMVGSGATMLSEGSNAFIGVSSSDIRTGQVLTQFGSGSLTAGLVGILLALGISALRASR